MEVTGHEKAWFLRKIDSGSGRLKKGVGATCKSEHMEYGIWLPKRLESCTCFCHHRAKRRFREITWRSGIEIKQNNL